MPAIIEIKYGKGKVIWSGATIENDERENFKEIFVEIINDNVKRKIILKSSKYVESVVFKDGEDYYINLFDLNFAEDEVKREFSVKTDGNYELTDLSTNSLIDNESGEFIGSFKKYIWLKLKHIKKGVRK